MRIMACPQTGLPARRQQKLRTFAYQPDKAEAIKAVLIFHHGYGEYLGRQVVRRASSMSMPAVSVEQPICPCAGTSKVGLAL